MPSERSRTDLAQMYAQIDSTIKAVFTENGGEKLPLWSVVESVRERTGRSAITIRKRLSELPFIDFEQHPTHPQKNI